MISDTQGAIAYVNDGMLKLIGLTREQAVGQSFPYPWLLPQDPLNKLPSKVDYREPGSGAQVESQIVDAEGTTRNISFSVAPLVEANGQRKWLLTIGRDIPPAPSSGGPAAQALLARATEEMPYWVQLSSLDGTIEMVNEAGCNISGYSLSEIVGQSWPYPWFIEGWRDGNYNAFEELGFGNELEFEATCSTRDGGSKSLLITLSIMQGNSGETARALMVAHDMTESEEWSERFLQA
jgi:PAS domain S-box-containing protein